MERQSANEISGHDESQRRLGSYSRRRLCSIQHVRPSFECDFLQRKLPLFHVMKPVGGLHPLTIHPYGSGAENPNQM